MKPEIKLDSTDDLREGGGLFTHRADGVSFQLRKVADFHKLARSVLRGNGLLLGGVRAGHTLSHLAHNRH